MRPAPFPQRHIHAPGVHKVERDGEREGQAVVEKIMLEGGGTLSLREDGPRVHTEARRQNDGQGLYKVWLRGGGKGRLLLGTLVPEGGELVLSRTLSRRTLEDAGCFAMVLECVPAPVAAAVSARLRIPTIGIGAGPDCDGQVLVFHDLLGLSDFRPRFAKAYADLGRVASEAVAEYAREVREGAFPAPEHCFSIRPEEWQAWQTRLEADSRANGKE